MNAALKKNYSPLKLKRGTALVVVAHPDDETIWMGGTIFQHNNVRWTILSLCRGDDHDRAPKFRRVCRYYGAKPIIANIEDEGLMTIKESIPKIIRVIKKHVGTKNFSYIFTHGANGEYGHPRHKGVYRAIKELDRRTYLHASNIFTFAYKPAKSLRRLADFSPSAEFRNALPETIFKKKQYIMNKLYGFRTLTPDFKSAGKVEAFNIFK